jgi:hypothetical protein
MDTTRIAVIAAITSAAFWAAKAVAIGIAGGLGQSPAETPLFLVGLVFSLVAVGSLTLSVTAGRPWWARIAAIGAAIVSVVAVVALINAALEAFVSSDHWVFAELNLWVLSLAVLAGTLWYAARPRPAGA